MVPATGLAQEGLWHSQVSWKLRAKTFSGRWKDRGVKQLQLRRPRALAQGRYPRPMAWHFSWGVVPTPSSPLSLGSIPITLGNLLPQALPREKSVQIPRMMSVLVAGTPGKVVLVVRGESRKDRAVSRQPQDYPESSHAYPTPVGQCWNLC